MNKQTSQYLVAGGIVLGAIGIGFAGWYIFVKKPVTTGTDPAAVKGWDAKIRVLLNKRKSLSREELNKRVAENYTPAERELMEYLIVQYSLHSKTMTETEKEKLARMMNLAFGY